MIKAITKLATLLAITVQFSAFAGGPPLFNTTWTPANLFVTAKNGTTTTGVITVTSNYFSLNGNTIIPTSPSVSYSTNTISPLGFNMASFFHNNNTVGSDVTSVIGYSIDLGTNTFVGTVLGNIRLQNNTGGNYNGTLPFTIVTQDAGEPFVTIWDLLITGTGANQLTFGVQSSGNVNYNWETFPSNTLSGSGSFSGNTISITGLPPNEKIKLKIYPTNFQRININSGLDRQRLIDIVQWGTVSWTGMQNAFFGCKNLDITATSAPDLSNVKSLEKTFSFCEKLNSPNLINWDISNVTTTTGMFQFASSFNQPIGSWNTSNVVNMESMFSSAIAFNQSINGWNTGNVTNMSAMFYDADAFNQPIDNWDVSNVINMSNLFSEADAFNQPLSNWNTSNVKYMASMFSGTGAFNQPIGNWNTSNVENMNQMFYSSIAFNQPIGNWNTSKVTDMGNMFLIASAFNQPIQNWNTSSVTDMSNMFGMTLVFNQPLANWDISNVIDMLGMFSDANAFNQNLEAWGPKLNPNVSLRDIFTINRAINGANYDAFLRGLDASTISGRQMDATGLQYCSAGPIKTSLINKGWIINDLGQATPSGSILIVNQPMNQSVCGGNFGTFTVSATGTKLSYAWGNGTGNILSTDTSFTTSVSGLYTVTISGDLCATSVSSGASLVNYINTSITSSLSSTTVCSGIANTYTISAIGSNLSYIWSNGLSNTSSMLTSLAGNNYNVTVSGSCGTAVSNTVSNTIIPSTQIVTQPISQTICGGNFVTFEVSSTGENLSYAWSNGSTTSGINTSVLGSYMVTISGACGVEVLNSVELTHFENTSIQAIPSPISVCSGLLAPISVTASGTNLVYSWSTGESSANVTISSPGTYFVTVTGTCGTKVSNPIELNIQNCLPTNLPIYPSSSFSIYPNPSKGSFTLRQTNGDNQLGNVEIYDLLGVLVHKEVFTSTIQNITISLRTGIYSVKVGNQVVKLIIEN
jgi:surface protein